MMKKRTMPIFTLPIVACPGEVLPLHIFEARYKAMIQHCRRLQENGQCGEFAIFQGTSDEPAQIGCSVRITSILREEENGTMDILTTGINRCKLCQTHEGATYPTGTVQGLNDRTPDWKDDLATEAYQLHRTLIEVVTGNVPPDSFYCGQHQLSFQLAPSLAMQMSQKQALLEMESEDERLQSIIDHTKSMLGGLAWFKKAKGSIQGWWDLNGAIRKWPLDKEG